MKRRRRFFALIVAPLLAFLAGCSTVPETGRSQLNLVPEGTLSQAAAAQYNQLKQDVGVSRDADKQARLRRIGEDVVMAARKRGADIPPAGEWEFTVFESQDVNAFAMPGGRVGFYEGIFPLFDNDAQLATVMAHEVGHVVAGHGRERVSQQLGAQLVLTGAAIGVGSGTDLDPSTQRAIMSGLGLGAQVGVLLPFSRLHESEADELGLIYMAQAGYDPREAVDFWRTMAQQGGGKPPEFLSTHPADQTRIENLKEHMDEAMEIYQQSGTAHLGPSYPENIWATQYAMLAALDARALGAEHHAHGSGSDHHH